MATLKGAGALKDVPLIVSVYDKSYFETKNGKTGNAFAEFRLHPDDERAKGQVFPELRATRTGEKPDGTPVYERRIAVFESQMADIKEAAGDNKFDLTNVDGQKVGECYVVEADLMVTNAKYGPMKFGTNERMAPDRYLAPHFKSIRPADPALAATVDGKTPLDRSYDLLKEARAAKAAEAPAKGPEVEIVETPQVDAVEITEEAPELG